VAKQGLNELHVLAAWIEELIEYRQRPLAIETDDEEELVEVDDTDAQGTQVIKKIPCGKDCDGCPRTDAVYVLECRPNTHPTATAARYFERVDQPWTGTVAGAKRLLYVGVTTNLHRRLHEHLNSPGNRGAQFTTVFPPLRILDVAWYSSYQEAQDAERLTAQLLQEAFPDDYVYQT
jgi:predicted GIY-YIG superfamily endonuclease